MIAFRVLHNGKEICVAGIGEPGVLNTNLTWTRGLRDSPHFTGEAILLHIGGLHAPTNEHRFWNAPDVAVGDTITIEIVETEDITPHDVDEEESD